MLNPLYYVYYDIQALKLSDDLNLNEIECVRLLVSANKEVCFPGVSLKNLLVVIHKSSL